MRSLIFYRSCQTGIEVIFKMHPIFLRTFALALTGSITLVSADDKSLVCGNTKITVSPGRILGGQQILQDFLVNISQPNSTRVFKFSPENDFLQLRCETNRNGDIVILVNHYCGGSGCAESHYSIIDLKTLRVLLNADARWVGNHSMAETVIGKKLNPFSCENSQHALCYNAIFE